MHIIRTVLFLLLMTTASTTHAQKGQYAVVNGLKMYYEIHGSGKPLVLLHGGGSTIQTNFGSTLAAFARNHQVIAVELQAHGHTADRKTPSSFEQDADDVAALLQQLHIEKASILGFSNGGSTAMQIAIRHPQVVDRLIVIAGIWRREDIPGWFWEMMLKSTFADMPQVYKDEFRKINPDPDALMAMYTRDSQRMINFKDWDENVVRTIKAPAFIIVGDQDVVTPEAALSLHRMLSGSRLAILPGTHGEYMGEIMTYKPGSKAPEVFVALVEDFLAGR